jgi:hypothetical protein
LRANASLEVFWAGVGAVVAAIRARNTIAAQRLYYYYILHILTCCIVYERVKTALFALPDCALRQALPVSL